MTVGADLRVSPNRANTQVCPYALKGTYPMKPIRILIAVCAAFFIFALPVWAGGWAVVTLDQLPDQVVAGQPLTVGFTIRQHGHTPISDLKPSVRFQKAGEIGDDFVFATPDGSGHYTATFTLPSKGEWNWAIETGFFPERQPMPSLSVVADSKVTAQTQLATPALSAPNLIGALGLVVGVGSLVVLARTKSAWAAGAAVLAIGVGIAGLAVGSSQAATSTVTIVETRSPVEIGQRLFIAKGCVVCHTHDAVKAVKEEIAFNSDSDWAPNLTDFTADANYLAKWLDDPSAVKPNTEMPKLNLSDDEIGSLIVFINAP